jgi:hypothetical protein
MRLFEFNVEPPVNAVLRDYQQQGYHVIGRGASALVMANDSSNDVIKVGPASDCWLNLAKIKSTNVHLPDIKSLEMYGDHYLAKVEKLRPVKETFFKTGLFQCIAAWLYLNGNWQNGRDVYLGKYNDEHLDTMAKDLENAKPDIVAALKVILGAKGSCSLDMHADNMMRRPSDNTLVFQDPLADISHLK